MASLPVTVIMCQKKRRLSEPLIKLIKSRVFFWKNLSANPPSRPRSEFTWKIHNWVNVSKYALSWSQCARSIHFAYIRGDRLTPLYLKSWMGKWYPNFFGKEKRLLRTHSLTVYGLTVINIKFLLVTFNDLCNRVGMIAQNEFAWYFIKFLGNKWEIWSEG